MDTYTGVLRYLALGQSSSVQCEPIESVNFLEHCGGTNSLELNYTTPNLDVHICAPATTMKSSWEVNRSQQNLTEEFFLDVVVPSDSNATSYYNDGGFSIHCVANSTRGYFELPNSYNNNSVGSILTEWPDSDTMKSQYNDRTAYSSLPTNL